MVRVIFVDHAGDARQVDAAGGASLMEAALAHDIEGIEAECGGACSCATCHVLVASEWQDKLPPASMLEADMLDMLEERQPASRLACQINIHEMLDGLTVHTPATQG